jgi:putative MATE family efflux protein
LAKVAGNDKILQMIKLKNLFTLVRQSLKGEHHDFTKGNINDAVILLAVPMILELGLESIFAVVDMYFVSGLGANAIATVGLTEAVVTLVYSVAMGISAGATAIVARRFGEKNPEAAAQAGAQAILLSLFASLIITVFGIFYSGDILAMMGASPEVVREGSGFTKILIGGNLPILLLFLINGIFRGVGDAAMAMKSLWIASGVNIILCPILISRFGVEGAAMATVIGRSSGVLYQCYHLFKGNSVIQIRLVHFKMQFELIKNVFTISWPAGLQFIIGSGSWIVITRMIAETGGTVASAGYQIAFRIFVFFMLPAWGLSNAAATLMGQNLGAGQPDRAEQSVITTARYAGFFMAAVMALMLALANPIIGVFTTDPEIFKYGIEGLRIIAAGFIFFGIGMVLTQALNGAGDTKTPTRFNIICFWIFQTPFAFVLVKFTPLGAAGALGAIPAAHVLMTVIAWRYFKAGKWRDVKV